MSTITKEWLQQKIADMEATRDEIPFGLDEDDSNTLAALRIALASLEAEPVAYTDAEELRFPHATSDMWPVPLGHGMDLPLYTAPPAPVSVPDEAYSDDCPDLHPSQPDAWAAGWNACRAAMLQGADGALTNEGTIPDNTSCKLRDAVETIRNSDIAIDAEKIFAERDALNSPVIPDGWALVPIEPTYQMCEAMGLTWESPRFPEHYKAMIAAAPQQEVK